MARTFPLDVAPVAGTSAPRLVGNCWEVSGGIGQLELRGLEAFAGSWARICGTAFSDGNESIWPRLHFDCGAGVASFRRRTLPECSRTNPEFDFVLFLPRRLRRAHLELISRAKRFSLGNLRVTPLSKNVATIHMLAVVTGEDGNRAGARHAWERFLTLFRPASRYPLHERYQEIRLQRGYSYLDWIREFEALPESDDRDLDQGVAAFQKARISILMPVYNTAPNLLQEAVESVIRQHYSYWELCISDDNSASMHTRGQLDSYARADKRIKVVFRDETGGMSATTNSALHLASGEYVARLDADSLLHPMALHFVSESIASNPDAGLLYTDEDKIDAQGRRREPYFKCDFNYELLLAQNMISHLAVYRRQFVCDLGGFRSEFDKSHDYDLALRASERLKNSQIIHIPRVLYHSRMTQGGMELSPDSKPNAISAARAVVADHLGRMGKEAVVMPAPEVPTMNRVRFSLPRPFPTVTIIIPTRDGGDRLRACIRSIQQRTTYSPFEILVVDNGSRDQSTLRFLQEIRGSVGRVIRDDAPFNFSALNNRAALSASGDFICLMNDDIEVITPDWVEEMLSFAAQPGVGAVGARLWYPNGTLQHAGVVLGLRSAADHVYRHLPRGALGYFGRAVLHQSFSAVTGACLMVRKSTYQQVNGLDEELTVSSNDIDFCLRLREAGFRNVWTPYAEMVHQESASRGPDVSAAQRERVAEELYRMEQRWGPLLLQDPAYSPNLTVERDDCSLAWPPRLERYLGLSRSDARI